MHAARAFRLAIVGIGILTIMLAFSATAFAEIIVSMKDGRQLRGTLVKEDETHLTIKIDGINTPLRLEDIASRQEVATIKETYEKRRAALKDDDLEGRYDLARWLFDDKQYALAELELTDMARDFPDDKRVEIMLRSVKSRIKLFEEAKAAEKDPPKVPDAMEPKRDPVEHRPVRKPGEVKLPTRQLEEKDVFHIRVYFVDPTPDAGIRIQPEVIDDFIKAYGPEDNDLRGSDNIRRFKGLRDHEQLLKMFEHRAREFYGRVEVHKDPEPMLTFRRDIMRNYLVNNRTGCATAKCHGGPDAGQFFLYQSRPTSDETVYTNFFILQKFETPQDFMINNSDPEDSLLLQMALPPQDSKRPHRAVEGFKPILTRGKDDPGYDRLLDWLRSLPAKRPDFIEKIEYVPPRGDEAEKADDPPAAVEPAATVEPAAPEAD